MLVVIAFFWAFEINGFCLGDSILATLNIPSWSNSAGAGEITINTLRTKELQLNLGAGKVHIEANKGLENIGIYDKEIVGEKQICGDGENYIKIDGGIGNIRVDN